MGKKNRGCINNRGHRSSLEAIWTHKTLYIITLALLSLCATGFARDLPQYVAPGEHITLLAPSGYTYQWTKFDANGHGTLAGTDQTCTIDVPNDAETGDILSATVTMTEAHGSGPSCIGYKAIYLQVQQFTCPILDNFCYHTAQPADAAKFIYDNFPTAKGFTYAWSGNGLDGTKLSGSQSDIQTYLNTLDAKPVPPETAGYTATFTVRHGTRIAWTCSDTFDVFSLPSGPITLPQ